MRSVGRADDDDRASAESGEGGGFGVVAKPAGVFVITGDDVRWQPAVDVNRIVLGGQIVGIVFLLVLRSILRARSARSYTSTVVRSSPRTIVPSKCTAASARHSSSLPDARPGM